MAKYSQVIEVRGHLIDFLILTKILDETIVAKGALEVQVVCIRKKKIDLSYARLIGLGTNLKNHDRL